MGLDSVIYYLISCWEMFTILIEYSRMTGIYLGWPPVRVVDLGLNKSECFLVRTFMLTIGLGNFGGSPLCKVFKFNGTYGGVRNI